MTSTVACTTDSEREPHVARRFRSRRARRSWSLRRRQTAQTRATRSRRLGHPAGDSIAYARRELNYAIEWRSGRDTSYETERAFLLLDRAIDVLRDILSMASEGRYVFVDDLGELSSQVGSLVEVAATLERYVALKLGDEIDDARGAVDWMDADSDRYSLAQRMCSAQLVHDLDDELDSLEDYLVNYACDEELELHAREIEGVRSRASGLPPLRDARRAAYGVSRTTLRVRAHVVLGP